MCLRALCNLTWQSQRAVTFKKTQFIQIFLWSSGVCHFVLQIFKMTLHSQSPNVRAALCRLKQQLAVPVALELPGLPNYLKHVTHWCSLKYPDVSPQHCVNAREQAELVIALQWGFQPVIMVLGNTKPRMQRVWECPFFHLLFTSKSNKGESVYQCLLPLFPLGFLPPASLIL